MNKADIIAKVSAETGVDPETCGKVVTALQGILQKELGASGGLGGALGMVGGFMSQLFGDKGGDS